MLSAIQEIDANLFPKEYRGSLTVGGAAGILAFYRFLPLSAFRDNNMADVRVSLDEADGGLPDICMRCGETAVVNKTRNMSWFPPWVNILILAGLLPYVIIVALLTKRARVQVPLCENHKGHWLYRNLLIWGAFVVFGLMVVAGITVIANLPPRANDDVAPFICVGSLVLVLAWLAIVVVAQSTA